MDSINCKDRSIIKCSLFGIAARGLFLSPRLVSSKKSEQLRLKITPELKESLQMLAKAKERTASWLAHKFIEDGIAKSKRKKNR